MAAGFRLYRFGVPIGNLWTDDGRALGLIPEPGQSVALLISTLRSVCALGTPTSWVFDDHAAGESHDHWAGPVERGDLSTLESGCGTTLDEGCWMSPEVVVITRDNPCL